MDTIFVLNNHKQVIDVLSNNGSNPSAPFFDDTYKAELDTGAETYEFTTVNNPRTNATLEVGNYILFKYNNKYKLFQIMETTDEHSEGKKLLTVYAEMAGMELLNDYCEPFTVEGNFITFLERVLQDTNWKVGVYSASLLDNIQMVSSTEHKNVYSLIQENLSTFGGVEIEFRVEFIGNQLAALLIDCYEAGTRGNRTYRRFEYGEDVKGITRNRNISDLATAVIGEGKNGTHFKDIEWDKNLGNPCNKPLQQNFVVDEDANDLWNNGGKYIKTIYKSDTEDPATLLQETWDYLQEIKQPKFDYDVDLALVAEDYKDINVGDTNYVVDFGYNPPILLEARVGTLELSFADPRDNKCTLTNYKELVSMLTQPVDFNTVGNMIQSHFPIEGEDIAMGAIGEGHIDVTYYKAIKADIISAGMIEVNQLLVNKADVQDLTAINASIENLRADKADITDLNAANGNITNLTSQVGQIETIINNHFTGTDAQILNITAENTTIDNAVIKNAMIDTVSADKVNAGTIDTNNVNIESEDGGIKISGATQQFKDKTGTVRVQIGKDAQGNFTFCLFSQDGTGILLDETGIKAGAVPDGLIVNNMVADNANISGNKIDIASVITNINNNTTSIKSSAIKFDDTGQSLLVAFNELKNTVDTIQEVTIQGDLSSVIEKVNTHTTQIGVMQGQISSLIQNTTITKQDGTVTQLKDEYNSTKTTVDSHATKIGSLETNYNKVSGDLASVTSKQTALEQNLDGFKTTVSNTYTTKSELNDSLANYSTTANMNSAIDQKANEITSSVSETYVTKTDANDTYATKSALSEVKQTADSITSTVSSMKIGGGNLLMGTGFENAKKDNVTSLTHWTRWGTIKPYENKSERGKLKLYFTDEGVSGGILQDISASRIPKGTQLVISYDLSVQKNVDKTYIAVEYFNSSNEKLAGEPFVDSSGNAQYGYQYHVFTTPTDIDYDRVRIILASSGNKSGSNSEYIVITLKGLMLEQGNIPTSWQNGYYDNENAISEVKQTAENITYKFENSSQPNLLPHSGVSSTNTAGWYTEGSSYFYTGHDRYLGIGNTSTNEAYCWSPKIHIGASGWYSLHGWVNAESNVQGADVFVIGSANEEGNGYDFIHHCCGIGTNTGWYHFYATFEVPSNIKTLSIRVDNNGRVNGDSGNYVVVFFGEFMLVRGKDNYPLYTDSVEGLYAGVTSIDRNGVHVKHDDGSSTNLNAKALNFYNSSNNLYAQVSNGVYKFWNGSNYIGYLGHAGWTADTSKRNISFAGEYGNTLTLSAKKTSSDTNYQTWLVVSGHEQNISGVNYHQGVILIQPRVSGIMHFYGQGTMGDTYPGMIFASTDAHLAIMGDSYVDIGIQVGDKRYNGIRVDEAGGNPYTTINMFGNLNMNGWHITNTQSVNSLNATSAQTYALRTVSDEESYSDPTAKAITDIFPSQTPTEGEIRWTDRETHFTSEVETGVYECYIEIPWWIAQNLENNYHVTITPTNGFYQYYVSERDPYYFIVRSDKDGMGFTFEIVGKLLDNNTIANNASIAGDQYLASDIKEPETANIVTELDTADIITPTDTTSDI